MRQSREKFSVSKTSRSKNLEHLFSLYGSARSNKTRDSISCRKDNKFDGSLLKESHALRNSCRILSSTGHAEWLSRLNATEEEKEPKNEASQEKAASPPKNKTIELKDYQEKFILNAMSQETKDKKICLSEFLKKRERRIDSKKSVVKRESKFDCNAFCTKSCYDCSIF